MTRWVKRWEVMGRSGKIWVVAQDVDGNYGCSCPVWKFHRKECHHIVEVKENLAIVGRQRPILKTEDISDKGDSFDPFMCRYQMIPKHPKKITKAKKAKKRWAIVTVNLQYEIPDNVLTNEAIKEFVANVELPGNYVEDTFDFVKVWEGDK
jgi:hypothetical protein